MSRRLPFRMLLVAFALLLWAVQSLPGDKSRPRSAGKASTDDFYRPFLINRIFNYYGNNGDGSYNKFSGDNEGFEFPKGSGKHLIFEDGVIWGGFHKGIPSPKLGGSIYRHGLQAGPIVAYGTLTSDPVATDPSDPANRVFRVRPDINPRVPFAQVMGIIDSSELAFISRYQSLTAQDIYDQYVKDWDEWPAGLGAPFSYGVDAGGNRRHAPMPYDPALDTPGAPGADQTLWYVANDMNVERVANLGGLSPIGLEMQRTVWGYNRPGPVAQTVFMRTLLVNKSGAPIAPMFFGQWSDPDVGDGGDDFVGCDSSRQVGYAYNSGTTDAVFGTPVPAVGFVLLQGPIVQSPGDSAIFRSSQRFGYRNIPMTSFSPVLPQTIPIEPTPPNILYYNLMQGRIGGSGADYIDPQTMKATKFCFSGDPLLHTGWLDGPPVSPPGDRKMILGSGPFTMAPGDTQEIVVALCAAVGTDHLQSTAILRDMAAQLRAMFRTGLSYFTPSIPTAPIVAASPLDGEVVLTWGDPGSVSIIEQTVERGYRFEGYNVYEYADESGSEKHLVATYDVADDLRTIMDTTFDTMTGAISPAILQQGSDNGIVRTIDIRTSALTSRGLVNGTKCYFAVTAYNYNPAPNASGFAHSTESTPQILTVIPQTANPGVRYNASVGEGLPVAHSTGSASDSAVAAVVDPVAIRGRNYEVRVSVTDSVINPDLGFKVGNPKWTIYDKDGGAALTPPSSNYVIDGASQIFEGVRFGIAGQPLYVAGKELEGLDWAGPTAINFVGVNKTPYCGGNTGFIGGALRTDQVTSDVQIVFTGAGAGQNAYDFVRTGSGGSAGAVYDGYYPQPFTVWELNPDGSRKRQIDFAFMESAGSSYRDNVWSPGLDSSDGEYWFIITESYSPTAKSKYTPGVRLDNSLAIDSVAWSGCYILRYPTSPAYLPGDVWTIRTRKIVTPADSWTFSTKSLAPTYSRETAKLDVTMINVYPNPYVGLNPTRSDPFNRSVTFTHLPPRAVVRVFSLAGVLVRTLLKSDPGQVLRWDLKNEKGRNAGSGMYIVFVEMPDLGVTKTLKLGLILEDSSLYR